MKHSSKCLNCDSEVTGNFCNNCGQKTDVHRIAFKHFITHDLFHGIFHLEKGMLFTAKEAIVRPGKAALDYIDGKRIRYYNVFYFILLLIGLNIFINNYYTHASEKYLPKNEIKTDFTIKNKTTSENKKLEIKIQDVYTKMNHFVTDNKKILLFCFVPLFALNGFLLFRKRRLNFSEHFIIAGITFLGILLLTTFDSILAFFEFTTNFDFIAHCSSFITPFAIFALVTFSYYQTFKDFYKKRTFSLRMFLFISLIIIELLLFLFLLIGYSINWEF